jgi:hypothetical protein
MNNPTKKTWRACGRCDAGPRRLESLETSNWETFEPPSIITSHTAANMDIRVLRSSDIPHVQQTNITNLPENYFCKYYMYHAMSWPQLSYVAVDVCRLFQLNCP